MTTVMLMVNIRRSSLLGMLRKAIGFSGSSGRRGTDALMIMALAATGLALAAPGAATPRLDAPTRPGEEFLWRPGYWYCGHFRTTATGVTVHRSEIVEGKILKSANGTIAALPEAFARYLGKQTPELKPIRPSEIRCFHYSAKRNLRALMESQSGVGAIVTMDRGMRPARVTRAIAVAGFSGPAEAALKSWRPPAGSTIYRP